MACSKRGALATLQSLAPTAVCSCLALYASCLMVLYARQANEANKLLNDEKEGSTLHLEQLDKVRQADRC